MAGFSGGIIIFAVYAGKYPRSFLLQLLTFVFYLVAFSDLECAIRKYKKKSGDGWGRDGAGSSGDAISRRDLYPGDDPDRDRAVFEKISRKRWMDGTRNISVRPALLRVSS